MAMNTRNIKLAKDETLMTEGEGSSSMYWLQQGQLAVHKMRGNELVLLGHVYSGELVGEMSFLDDEPRSATVKALSDCELVEIPSENFESIINSQPKWMQILIKTLVARLRKANARIRV